MMYQYSKFSGLSVAIEAVTMLFILAILVTATVVSIIIGNSIERRDPKFLYKWQKMFILTGVMFFVLAIFMGIINAILYAVLGVGAARGILTGFIGIISYLIPLTATFFIWNTYFIKSARVYVYMGSDEYLRRSLFNKNTPVPININLVQRDDNKYGQNKSLVSTHWCPNCGNAVFNDAEFCPMCGEKC